MVDYATAHIFWVFIVLAMLKILKDVINPRDEE